MKNKFYYLLILCYFAILWFVLDINGVFTGEISITSLSINLGFLLVIGILFIISFISFGQVNAMAHAMEEGSIAITERFQTEQKNLWEEYKAKDGPFSNPVLNRQFAKYQRKIASNTTAKGYVTKKCALEDYFNEELLNGAGRTYFNAAIPGTLTGLGILGTFVGLSLGMSSFSGNDIYTISDNVAPLLDGMKVAFHTSVYGIFLSLIFNFAYRGVMTNAYEKLAVFLDTLHEYVEPQVSDIDENMSAMLVYQANTANSLKTIMECMQGQSEAQLKGLEKIVQQFMTQMSETMETDFRRIGSALNEACEAQTTYARNFQRLETSTQMLLDSCRLMSEDVRQSIAKQKDMEEQLDKAYADLKTELYTFRQMKELS